MSVLVASVFGGVGVLYKPFVMELTMHTPGPRVSEILKKNPRQGGVDAARPSTASCHHVSQQMNKNTCELKMAAVSL